MSAGFSYVFYNKLSLIKVTEKKTVLYTSTYPFFKAKSYVEIYGC